jgi:hypothetical protein
MKKYLQHGDGPTFTVPKITPRKRKSHYYGSEYPCRGFFARNKALIISTAVGLLAILTFMSVLTIGLLLLPEACFIEVQRQVAIVAENIGGANE